MYRIITITALSAALIACGGGGGSSKKNTQSTAETIGTTDKPTTTETTPAPIAPLVQPTTEGTTSDFLGTWYEAKTDDCYLTESYFEDGRFLLRYSSGAEYEGTYTASYQANGAYAIDVTFNSSNQQPECDGSAYIVDEPTPFETGYVVADQDQLQMFADADLTELLYTQSSTIPTSDSLAIEGGDSADISDDSTGSDGTYYDGATSPDEINFDELGIDWSEYGFDPNTFDWSSSDIDPEDLTCYEVTDEFGDTDTYCE